MQPLQRGLHQDPKPFFAFSVEGPPLRNVKLMMPSVSLTFWAGCRELLFSQASSWIRPAQIKPATIPDGEELFRPHSTLRSYCQMIATGRRGVIFLYPPLCHRVLPHHLPLLFLFLLFLLFFYFLIVIFFFGWGHGYRKAAQAPVDSLHPFTYRQHYIELSVQWSWVPSCLGHLQSCSRVLLQVPPELLWIPGQALLPTLFLGTIQQLNVYWDSSFSDTGAI